MHTYDVIIIGGGLAGLTSAIHLAKHQVSVLLLEKDSYPRHKVCGEYVSNEVLGYLNFLDIDIFAKGAKSINRFAFSGRKGREIAVNLPLGGFGISRYALDKLMLDKAVNYGVVVVRDTVTHASLQKSHFEVRTKSGNSYVVKNVLGAYGKRSGMDGALSRKFIKNKSPWLGVKAHYKANFPDNLVALHNFQGGYCGLSKVETNHVNACYLTHYDVFKEFANLEIFQKEILEKNKALRTFFDTAEMVFDKPIAISQVSFEAKQPVEQHILMIGDSAGLIHPLCGNGMAMAIHSAKIASELLIKSINTQSKRVDLEQEYISHWHNAFDRRLRAGRAIQRVLLNDTLTNIGVTAIGRSAYVLRKIIQSTHGSRI